MVENLVVLITGAAGRLGSAIARRIVAESGRVILIDVNESSLKKLTADLPPNSICRISADAGSPEEVNNCLLSGVRKFGRVDAAIHAAYPRSVAWGTRFEDLQKDQLRDELDAQLGGSILFSQAVLKFFKNQGHGNLIHLSSIMGVAAPKFENYAGTEMISPIEYTAIKSGIIAITKYLAKYYKGNNIRINCISPGGILDRQPKIFLDRYRASCNDKGMLDAEDVVGSALYLLSEQSRFVTGQNLIVDDGWSL